MSSRQLHILLLCHFEAGSASTIIEHIHAFPQFSKHRYYVLSNLGDLPTWLDLSRFDGVIIHYSLIACYDNYLSPDARRRIREFDGFKAAFVQDDYRWINDTVNALAFMRITALFPLAGPDIIDQVYSPERLPGVHRETVLTGYVPEALTRREVKPFAERPIDVGYRARKVPMWIGAHTLQKWQIADRFLADAPRYGLKVDISYREEDRIYGERWIEFMSNCKAMLGTESGASVCDFTGDIQRNVEAHLRRHPDASFEELSELYFKDVDGKIMMNVISPRTFEAACLRTLMILYEGHYSGILLPWRHYVPLRRDHSNMDDVAAILADPARAQAVIDTAYREIALNPAYTFRAMVNRIDAVIAQTYEPATARQGYSDAEFAWRTRDADLDMTKYASVSSPLRFEPGHDLSHVFSQRADRPAAVSAPGQAVPHELHLRLTHAMKVSTVHLVWEHPAFVATGGRLDAMYRGNKLAEATLPAFDGSHYVRIHLPEPLRRVDELVLLFGQYGEGDRLRLRDVRFDVERLPLIERIRRARHKAGLWLGRQVSDRWMQLPAPLRRLLKKPVRATYDRVFGRRQTGQ